VNASIKTNGDTFRCMVFVWLLCSQLLTEKWGVQHEVLVSFILDRTKEIHQ
jgi:hypothetical protein